MLYQLATRIIDGVKEATIANVARKQRTITSLFPAHPGRVQKVGHMGGVRLDKLGTESWHFKIHSGTKKSVWYDAVIKFLNITPILEKLVKDRRLWTRDKSKVDLRLLASEFRNRAEVKITCNCPCQQYWGFNYILSKDKYNAKYGDKETRSPKVRNPHQYGAVCKHLDALFKALPFYNSTIARWLDDFYGKDIEEFEVEAKKEFEKFKKAGEELGKKVEPKEKPEVEKTQVPEENSEEATEETKESKIDESVGYSGAKALYKVYHDIERNIDPSPEDIFEALNMMEEYYRDYLEWYHKCAEYKTKDKEIYKAYEKRLQEIRATKIGKDPGKALVALDTAINQWHRDYPAIVHLIMDVEELEPSAREKQMIGWFEKVSQILTKLGRLPEESPYADYSMSSTGK